MIITRNLRSHFVQSIVKNGNLYRADRIFRTALKTFYVATAQNASACLYSAVKNTKVFFSLRKFYRGGGCYLIPSVILNNSEEKKAVRSVLRNSLKRRQTVVFGLTSEIYLASQFKGETVKSRNEFNAKLIRGISFTRFLKKIK